eukprot:SAG31_NODE_4859_length_2902_cov_8.536568_1_plen_44_part_00
MSSMICSVSLPASQAHPFCYIVCAGGGGGGGRGGGGGGEGEKS